MTSTFDASSHLKTIPSRLPGSIHFVHWHPVVNASSEGTIISTFSFLCTTPITLTVLPSLMYLLSPLVINLFFFFFFLYYYKKERKKEHIINLPFFQSHDAIIACQASLPQPPCEVWGHVFIQRVDFNNHRFVHIRGHPCSIPCLYQCSQSRLEIRYVEIHHMPLPSTIPYISSNFKHNTNT
ncbi:hypothetical protein Hanom_Chr06g00579591 [Helianthus anomalus]